MANQKPLLKTEHKDLTIALNRRPEYGDAVLAAVTFPAEFRHIQHYYPICFRKDEETKEVQALALFGFEQGENLFIKDEKWDAQYIPMTIEIQPFLIGLDNKNTETGSIYIDMDSPRVNPTDGGTRVFNEDGSETDYLAYVRQRLEALHQMSASTQAFYEFLEKFDLLEPFVLEVGFVDGTARRLKGFHTIHEERFRSLDGKVIQEMWELGYLLPCFMMFASLSSITDLVDRKNVQMVTGRRLRRMTAALDISEYDAKDLTGLDELVATQKPFVVRGLINHWPLKKMGEGSFERLSEYLLSHSEARKMVTHIGNYSSAEHIGYNDSMEMNFRTEELDLNSVLERIKHSYTGDTNELVYVSSVEIKKYFRNLGDENNIDLGDRETRAGIWIGSKNTVPTHFDFPDNLACVAVGKRKFTLFPPEQTRNLYPGPLDNTPAGGLSAW